MPTETPAKEYVAPPTSCYLCKLWGKTWEGSDPTCAFGANVPWPPHQRPFSSNNWGCGCLRALWALADYKELLQYGQDTSFAALPFWNPDRTEHGFLVLSRYKSRGRTTWAEVYDGTQKRTATEEDVLDCLRYHEWPLELNEETITRVWQWGAHKMYVPDELHPPEGGRGWWLAHRSGGKRHVYDVTFDAGRISFVNRDEIARVFEKNLLFGMRYGTSSYTLLDQLPKPGAVPGDEVMVTFAGKLGGGPKKQVQAVVLDVMERGYVSVRLVSDEQDVSGIVMPVTPYDATGMVANSWRWPDDPKPLNGMTHEAAAEWFDNLRKSLEEK